MQDLRQVRRLGNLQEIVKSEKIGGQPVAGLCAKTAGEWFAGCCGDIVEVEVVRGRART